MKKVFLGVFVVALLVSGAAMAAGQGTVSQDRLLLALVADDAAAAAPAAPADQPAAAPQAEEPKHKKHDAPDGVGGYGGPMVSYMWMDLSPLDPMTDDRGLDSFDNGMFVVGGSGGMLIKNVYIGGFGFGGSQHLSDEVNDDDRNADVSLGGGGVILELNSGKGQAGVALGAAVGAAGISLQASGEDLSAVKGKNGHFSESAGLFMAYPYLGVWFAPTDWMFVQVDGGYMFFNFDPEGKDWQDDNGNDMVDDPITGGAIVNLKLNFGTMGK